MEKDSKNNAYLINWYLDKASEFRSELRKKDEEIERLKENIQELENQLEQDSEGLIEFED